MRSEIAKFASFMEHRLAQHDADRGDSWRRENAVYLLRRLREEVAELETALECDRNWPETITAEAADVANIAMMLADNYARRFDPATRGA
jgi:hypothetical protein